MTRQYIDSLLLGLAALLLIASFLVSALSREAFFTYFGAEDSLVETATAVLLVAAGLVLFARALRLRPELGGAGFFLALLYGLAYLWAGGEEVSWGQRILGFESPEYFRANNDQQEFTLHNLVVAGIKLDEVIFGPVLSAVILSYLLLLPLAWRPWGWVRHLVQRLAIPVPRLHHAGFALAVTLVIPLLGESRRWEVYECIFALLSLAIFLHPANSAKAETAAAPVPDSA